MNNTHHIHRPDIDRNRRDERRLITGILLFFTIWTGLAMGAGYLMGSA